MTQILGYDDRIQNVYLEVMKKATKQVEKGGKK